MSNSRLSRKSYTLEVYIIMTGRGNAATVQGTNDSSILSKHSMTKLGYADDAFLEAFTLKSAPRRAPLINRGYYIRSKSVDSVIHSFLMERGPKQIVSLGAGFDTTFFRLSAIPSLSQHMQDLYYVEVDFPEVTKRKMHLIDGSACCKSHVTHRLNGGQDCIKISTPNYCLLGIDLADITTLDRVWFNTTVKLVKDLPTLVLSECVMTYMEHQISTKLIQFASQSFPNSLFVTYEQVQPYDAFGQFMRLHFDKLNSSLKGISTYPTREKQMERYWTCGYKKVDVFTMKEFYDCLPSDEMTRISQLEYFDEFEEWHMKCYHYVLILARHDESFSGVESLINSVIRYEEEPEGDKETLPASYKIPGAEQYGHASCLSDIGDGRSVLLTHGGFGVTEGKHCRQEQIRAYAVEQFGETCVELECSDALPCRLHHTMTNLGDSTIFMFGGRLSPAKPLDNPVILRIAYNTPAGRVKVEVYDVADSGDKPESRWRHAAVYISIDGADCVLITGGLTTSKTSPSSLSLSSCHLFNVSTSTWSCVPDFPQILHSHSMCYDGDRYVYSVGGLSTGNRALSDCYRLNMKELPGGWCRISLPIQPVYSHNVHMLDGNILVVGGIGLDGRQLGIQYVKLPSLTVRQLLLPVTIDNSLRMYFNHTSHTYRVVDQTAKLIVVGGGGNCFSFGTHINRQISIHTMEC